MAGVHHIACPACGGVLSVSEIDRVTTCTYCRVRLLIEGASAVPEYWIEPRLEEEAARRALLDAMRAKDVKPGLVRKSRLHAAQLLFAPYHETFARRLGTVTLRESSPHLESGRATRVVMGDIHRVEPALDVRGWGLEGAGYASRARATDAPKQPLDRRRASACGVLLRPTCPASRALDELSVDARSSTFEDHSAFAEVRVQRVYYPIWRLKYRYAGRLWGATFDAVTGELMAARLPLDDRRRALWFIGAASLVGFALGKMCALIVILLGLIPRRPGALLQDAFDYGRADPHGLGPALLLALLLLVVMVGLLAYEQFRYPQEIVVDGTSREHVRIGGPARTPLDRFFDLLRGMPWNRDA